MQVRLLAPDQPLELGDARLRPGRFVGARRGGRAGVRRGRRLGPRAERRGGPPPDLASALAIEAFEPPSPDARRASRNTIPNLPFLPLNDLGFCPGPSAFPYPDSFRSCCGFEVYNLL